MTEANPVGRFATQAQANLMSVVGPIDAGDVASKVAALADGPIALPVNDPVVDACAIPGAIDAGGVLPADDPSWSDLVERAALGVTSCVVAVADTGTMVVVAAPGRPRALSLIPPHHVVIVPVDSVVDSLETACTRLPDPMPSNLHWVSGPSRTGDLEMISTIGIHGPLRVTAVLVRF
ncbi:MAG: LutC/YkgG family protein [Acidimicrobiia bacterium]